MEREQLRITFKDLADAIRAKSGVMELINPDSFADAINDLGPAVPSIGNFKQYPIDLTTKQEQEEEILKADGSEKLTEDFPELADFLRTYKSTDIQKASDIPTCS